MSFKPIDIPPPPEEESNDSGKYFVFAAVCLLFVGVAWSLRGTFFPALVKDSMYEDLVIRTKPLKNTSETESFDMWDDMKSIDSLPEDVVISARKRYEADERKRAHKTSSVANKPVPQADNKNNTAQNSKGTAVSSTATQPDSSTTVGAIADEALSDREWVTETYNGLCALERRPKRCTKLRIRFRCDDRYDKKVENRKSKVKSCEKSHLKIVKEIAK